MMLMDVGFFTDVWGPDPVKVQSPGEHGLICDESHGKYKIKDVLRSQTEKKKASETREEERSFVILTGHLRFFFLVSFPTSVICPLSLGEMQQSALWGEAASSLESHLGGFCGCQ